MGGPGAGGERMKEERVKQERVKEVRLKVLVIAGASSDSGQAVAHRFSADGWTVIALGSNAERLEPVEADERIVVDLRDAAATTAAAKAIVERWGRVDGVIHLVGGWSPGHGD